MSWPCFDHLPPGTVVSFPRTRHRPSTGEIPEDSVSLNTKIQRPQCTLWSEHSKPAQWVQLEFWGPTLASTEGRTGPRARTMWTHSPDSLRLNRHFHLWLMKICSSTSETNLLETTECLSHCLLAQKWDVCMEEYRQLHTSWCCNS